MEGELEGRMGMREMDRRVVSAKACTTRLSVQQLAKEVIRRSIDSIEPIHD